MAGYFNVSNMQDNYGSDNTVIQKALHYVIERTHVMWVLGWFLVTLHYVHCKPRLIIIWIGVQFRSLPPGNTAASVAYCTILRFLNVPTLAARCLSRPQPAVAP